MEMKWKIFSMEWKKTSSMQYGKIVFHSISYHALGTGIKSRICSNEHEETLTE